MGGRLRRTIVASLLILTIATPAFAESFSSCWVTTEWNPASLQHDQVTRCRISGGGETVDYASDDSIPSVLYPDLGNDVTGECWFYRSAATNYVILNVYADGVVEIGYLTDPNDPGGLVAIGGFIPRCTSEPIEPADPAADAWAYALSYIHSPPAPALNPAPGQGVTGLDTFVGVEVPPDHSATLASGASTLEVEIDVASVIVSWGDGRSDEFPPLDEILAGYPDGSASHVYETHHPDGAIITVEYDWAARWRVDGGVWTTLPVPNTSTAVDYPVAQVVSRLTD